MNIRSKTVLLMVILTLVALGTGGSSYAQALLPPPQESSVETTITIRVSEEDVAFTQAMWTREVMRAAKPLKTPMLDRETEAKLITSETPDMPGMIPSGRPQTAVIKQARLEFAEEWNLLELSDSDTVGESTAVPQGTTSIFDSFQINSSDYPYNAIGKLFFKTPAGTSSCTASVIGQGSAIVTAAHCVYDTENNLWYSNWAFAPAYRNGARPYGTFPGVQAWVLRGWADATGVVRSYDVAVIRVGNNSSGRPVTDYTGWLGRSWGYGSVQHHFAFGYPGNLGNSEYLQTCAAESYSDGTDVLGMGCDMTYGSSGGPWIRVFKPYSGAPSTNFVNSVVSGGTPPTPTFQGPRFTSNNIVPLCNDASCDTVAILPIAPSNLTASATSASQINLAWRDNASNETGFKIERKVGSGSSWSQIATVGANATTYQNTGLAASTTYYYRVRAYNGAGDSGYSNEANATTAGTLPAAPNTLTASAASASQINLAWRDNASNETGFKIERKTGAGGSWSQIATVGTNATSYQNTGLAASTTYYYRARAYNGAGDSGYSNEAGATTSGTPVARNLAIGRPVTATSQESSSYAPSKGNDGNTSTRWSSRQSTTLGDEWWRVDLGGQTYDRVVIRWEAAYAVSHYIGWSNDGVNFTGNWYSIGSPGRYNYQIGTRNARYLIVVMRTRASRMNNYSFYEFEVYNGAWPSTVAVDSNDALEIELQELAPDLQETPLTPLRPDILVGSETQD